MSISEETFKNIAHCLEAGEVVYLNKTTHEIISYPESDEDEYDYIRVEVMALVDADPGNFYQFEPPTSRESYRFMEEFAGFQETDALRAKLLRSLLAKRPFRAFRDALEWEGLIDEWYAFKEAQLIILARDSISLIKPS